MSLKGVLTDFPVSDVFQLISQQRKTGVLEVTHGSRVLEVLFLEGEVLRARPAESRPDGALAGYLLRTGVVSESELSRARREQEETLEPLGSVLLEQGIAGNEVLGEISRLTTHETIFELFLWDEGRFGFGPQELQRGPWDEPINAEMFLLDALRMRDEWVHVSTDLPDLAVIVIPAIEPDSFRSQRGSIAEAAGVAVEELDKLFKLIDGRLSARRIIDLSRLGTFKGARALVELRRASCVRLVEPERSAAPASAGSQRRGSPLRWAALGIAAVVALLLNLWPRAQRDDYPLPPPSAAAAGQRVESDHLRAALEAHRWLKGEYPATLPELEGTTPGILAALRLGRYSYARTGEGYALRLQVP